MKGMYSSDDNCSVSKLEKDYVFIKVVREYTNLVYQLLWNVPLYSVLDEKKIIDPDNVDQKISILIIGLGDVGREMLIAGYWCGQFGYVGDKVKIRKFPLEIHVVDRDAYVKKSKWICLKWTLIIAMVTVNFIFIIVMLKQKNFQVCFMGQANCMM